MRPSSRWPPPSRTPRAALIGREPREIWQDSLQDGQRRLARPGAVLAATGLLGGFHVTLGLLALVVSTGALSAFMPEPAAHVLGSLTFGLGFVFLPVFCAR